MLQPRLLAAPPRAACALGPCASPALLRHAWPLVIRGTTHLPACLVVVYWTHLQVHYWDIVQLVEHLRSMAGEVVRAGGGGGAGCVGQLSSAVMGACLLGQARSHGRASLCMSFSACRRPCAIRECWSMRPTDPALLLLLLWQRATHSCTGGSNCSGTRRWRRQLPMQGCLTRGAGMACQPPTRQGSPAGQRSHLARLVTDFAFTLLRPVPL